MPDELAAALCGMQEKMIGLPIGPDAEIMAIMERIKAPMTPVPIDFGRIAERTTQDDEPCFVMAGAPDIEGSPVHIVVDHMTRFARDQQAKGRFDLDEYVAALRGAWAAAHVPAQEVERLTQVLLADLQRPSA